MAGTYAHIALVYSVCRDTNALDSIPALTTPMKRWLLQNEKFCELGSVGPDYPYLALFNKQAEGWANIMHYWKTADFVRAAIAAIHELDWRQVDTQRCIVWLFGFTAHLVTDLTVHPVVQLRVGDYATNKTQHRICELNQDVFIFHELGLGEITTAEYVRDCGIASCSAGNNRKNLHPAIAKLWRQCLGQVSLTEARQYLEHQLQVAAPTRTPDPDQWHKHFVLFVDKILDEGRRFPPISRHILESQGLLYLEFEDIDKSYIEDLETPTGARMHYKQVFEEAQKNIKRAWGELAAALSASDPGLFKLANGDLDTGKDEAGNPIYWT